MFAAAVLVFGGLLALFGYPLVNSLTHVAERLPTMVDQVQRGHGWLAHTLQRFRLLTWVQKNAPKLKQYARNLGKPALSVGANLSRAVHLDHRGPDHHRLPVAVHAPGGPRAAAGPARHHQPPAPRRR